MGVAGAESTQHVDVPRPEQTRTGRAHSDQKHLTIDHGPPFVLPVHLLAQFVETGAVRRWPSNSARDSRAILIGVCRARIRQLISDLERAGFSLVPGGKGGHKKFRHPTLAGPVILSGNDGDDAKDYQEKQVRTAIREAAK